MSFRLIKQRIKGVSAISKITRAIEMMAAAKLKQTKVQVQQAHAYTSEFWKVFAKLYLDYNSNHLKSTKKHSILYVVITSDRGLCSSFNNTVIKVAKKEAEKIKQGVAKFICIGTKGYEALLKQLDFSVIKLDTSNIKNFKYEDIINLAKDIEYITKIFRSVK